MLMAPSLEPCRRQLFLRSKKAERIASGEVRVGRVHLGPDNNQAG